MPGSSTLRKKGALHMYIRFVGHVPILLTTIDKDRVSQEKKQAGR